MLTLLSWVMLVSTWPRPPPADHVPLIKERERELLLFVLSALGCDVWLTVTGSRFASGLPRVIIYIVQLNLKIPLTSSSNEAPGTFLKAPARLYLGNNPPQGST